MIIDSKLELSDAQALSGVSAGSAVTASTNVIDMGSGLTDGWGTADTPEIGGMVWNTNINVAMVGASAALNCTLVTNAAATITSGSTTIMTVNFPALSAAGTKKSVRFPVGTTCLRYVGVLFDADTADLTSATVDSMLTLDNEKYS